MEYIRLTTLPKGAIVYVETNIAVYELNMLTDGKARVCSNKPPFNEKPLPCTIIGCVGPDGTVFADCIYHDTQLLISTPKRRYVTTKVCTASIRGNNWYYEFWTDLNT